MNLILIGLIKADFFLLARVFMPICEWIDWRFHRSPYQQAKAVIVLAQALQIAATVVASRHAWWITPIMAMLSVFLHFTIFRDYRRKLDACQRQFERRPDRICWEQYYFLMQLVPPVRLLQLIMGLLIMAPLLAADIAQGGGWGALMNSWVWLVAVMLYIAGCPPPTRPRREKKVWSLAGPLPQGA